MFPTSNGPPFQIFLNDSHSAGSRGFLFLIAFSVHPISPPCFKLKAPLLQRVLGSIYWWVLGKVEQFVRCSVLKRMPIWRIEAYFHRNGLRRGLWRKPLVFRTPRGSPLTFIAALAQVESPNASLALVCKYNTGSLCFWLSYIFLFILPLTQMFLWSHLSTDLQ